LHPGASFRRSFHGGFARSGVPKPFQRIGAGRGGELPVTLRKKIIKEKEKKESQDNEFKQIRKEWNHGKEGIRNQPRINPT
jgi:hypothetical protein